MAGICRPKPGRARERRSLHFSFLFTLLDSPLKTVLMRQVLGHARRSHPGGKRDKTVRTNCPVDTAIPGIHSRSPAGPMSDKLARGSANLFQNAPRVLV